MNTLDLPSITQLSLAGLTAVNNSRRFLLVETQNGKSDLITELIAALALHDPFYVVAGGEWLPGYALTRTLRVQTIQVKQCLDRIILTRPFTCYQILDLLSDRRPGSEPLLILDFLHHFYNDDVDLSVRLRVFEQSCRQLQRLSLFRSVLVFIERLSVPLYQQFFSSLAILADKAFQLEDESASSSVQLAFF